MTHKTASQQLTREEKDYLRKLLTRPALGPESDIGELTISGHDSVRGLLGPFVGSESVQLSARKDGLTLISDLQLKHNTFTQQVSLHLDTPAILDNHGTPRNLRVETGKHKISLQDPQRRFADTELVDISATGASMASTSFSSLRVGDVLAPLRLTVDNCESVVLAGEVVRVEKQARPARTMIGIRFLGHTQRSRKMINHYVFQCHAQRPERQKTNPGSGDPDATEVAQNKA